MIVILHHHSDLCMPVTTTLTLLTFVRGERDLRPHTDGNRYPAPEQKVVSPSAAHACYGHPVIEGGVQLVCGASFLTGPSRRLVDDGAAVPIVPAAELY